MCERYECLAVECVNGNCPIALREYYMDKYGDSWGLESVSCVTCGYNRGTCDTCAHNLLDICPKNGVNDHVD